MAESAKLSKNLSQKEIENFLLHHEADLVGLAKTQDVLSEIKDQKLRSFYTELLDSKPTLIVFAKRILTGVSYAKHLASKQISGGRYIRHLERLSLKLTRELEHAGQPTLPLFSLAFDYENLTPLDLTPAGQGSWLLRQAAVTSGLGSFGLNNMLLTKKFGPRVYLGGVATSMKIDLRQMTGEELCLGLEKCGRCAAICPEKAIPLKAKINAKINDCRSLDCAACAHASQPYGFQNFVSQFSYVLDSFDAEENWKRLRTRNTSELWMEMTQMKEASVTGCSDCLQVCPVGEDYEKLSASPARKSELPENLERIFANGEVEVKHLGPQIKRQSVIPKS